VNGPRIRVAAYVVRFRATAELLVFDHVGMPEAGTQIPAGGVDPDEALEAAAIREVAEETGLRAATVVRSIAVDESPHPGNGIPRRTTFFLLRTADDAEGADAWEHTVHGDGSDAGLVFACRFVPLPLEQRLADEQDAYLGRVDPGWTTTARRARGHAVPSDGKRADRTR
jgi:ADP-ribose pyrophosphatase YjhB (NUDIX family)